VALIIEELFAVDPGIGAAISEPDVGSDVSSVSTRAELDGDE
jgi:alkylation response protein AidB-like acyl-CoA dehydrogenase